MTDLLFRLLLPMGLAGSLFCLLLAPLRPLTQRLKAGWRKRILLTGALLFLLPLGPLFSLFLRAATSTTAATAPAALQAVPAYGAGQALGQALEGGAQTTAQPTFSPLALLALLYWLGLAVVVATGAIRYFVLLRRLGAHSQALADGPERGTYEALCRQMKIGHSPALWQSDAISAPILVGLVRPRILLPAVPMPPQALEFALRHELCHHMQHDLPCKFLLLGVGALHWYNPLVHLLRREFGEVCEQSCDEAVVAGLGGDERKSYAGVLLDFSGPTPSPMVSAFASPASRLKTRLARLVRPARPGRALRTAGVALAASLALAATLAGCSLSAGAASSASEASGPASSQMSDPLSQIPSSAEEAIPVSSLPVENTSLPQASVSAGSPAASVASDGALSSMVAPVSDAGMMMPVPSALYSSRGMTSGHRGLDFNGAETGDPIFAAAAGTVTESGWHYSYGHHVVIDHGDGLSTLYAHNDANHVSTGDTVVIGQMIGTIGETGNSAGPHLHFEVVLNGEIQDPIGYLVFPEGFTMYHPES